MPTETIHTTCCIAGGGPAGMMLGFLLARAGVDVVVLEKHKDFLRDFRGDTIHPSTLELMLRARPARRIPQAAAPEGARRLSIQIGDEFVTIADLRHVPTHCKFIAFMPQWDFLDFLADHGKHYQKALRSAHARRGDRADRRRRPRRRRHAPRRRDRTLEIRADLVVGADGRHSTLREAGGLTVDDYGAPMDVLWFRVSRKKSDTGGVFGHAEAGECW